MPSPPVSFSQPPHFPDQASPGAGTHVHATMTAMSSRSPSQTSQADPADLRALYDSATYLTGAPHDAVDRLRAVAPVVWVPEPSLHGWPEGTGYWAVLTMAECREVLRAADRFSSNLGGTQLRDPPTEADLDFVRQMMLNQDPPAHNRLRGLSVEGVRAAGDRSDRSGDHRQSFCVGGGGDPPGLVRPGDRRRR